MSGWLEIGKDILFSALATALFGTVIYRAIWLRDVSGVTSLVFGAMCCAVIVGINRFEFITLSGTRLEARARAVIQQAEVSQREFLKLAALTGELLIDLNAAQGRWVGAGDGAARDRRKTELLQSLSSIGMSKEELDKIAATDRKYNIIDYVGGITNAAAKAIPKERVEEWQKAVSPIRTSEATMLETSPQTLEHLLGDFGVLTDRTRELIEDYRRYLASGEQRRPEVWAQRYSW